MTDARFLSMVTMFLITGDAKNMTRLMKIRLILKWAMGLLLLASWIIPVAGQQVHIVYLMTETAYLHQTADGRVLDFPEQYVMASLYATTVASIWSQDSMMYKRAGVFAQGFRHFVPGAWEFRDKRNGYRLRHLLFYGRNEFVESDLKASDDERCGDWVVDPFDQKAILGLPCIAARQRCPHGERNAYYTRSLNLVDGPVYIPQLPGLILEFRDKKFHYIAQGISANDTKITAPETVTLIPEGHRAGQETRVRVDGSKLSLNEWINLNNHYLID